MAFEFKKYRKTQKNLKLLKKACDELGYELEYDTPSGWEVGAFAHFHWHEMFGIEVNKIMQRLEKEGL